MKSNSRRIEIIAHTTRAEYSTRTEKKKTSHDANKRRITSLTNRIAHPKKKEISFFIFLLLTMRLEFSILVFENVPVGEKRRQSEDQSKQFLTKWSPGVGRRHSTRPAQSSQPEIEQIINTKN
jgi:hypothetical protein